MKLRNCGVNRNSDLRQPSADESPPKLREHHERDFPTSEILLIPNVLVGRDKHVKSGFFRIIEKFAVSDRGPSSLPSLGDAVASSTRG
ncbi:MAG TPA: hypothetical protein VGL72_11100 [Bryobacteraceae bacterium]|jgi:hypothetical protein